MKKVFGKLIRIAISIAIFFLEMIIALLVDIKKWDNFAALSSIFLVLAYDSFENGEKTNNESKGAFSCIFKSMCLCVVCIIYLLDVSFAITAIKDGTRASLLFVDENPLEYACLVSGLMSISIALVLFILANKMEWSKYLYPFFYLFAVIISIIINFVYGSVCINNPLLLLVFPDLLVCAFILICFALKHHKKRVKEKRDKTSEFDRTNTSASYQYENKQEDTRKSIYKGYLETVLQRAASSMTARMNSDYSLGGRRSGRVYVFVYESSREINASGDFSVKCKLLKSDSTWEIESKVQNCIKSESEDLKRRIINEIENKLNELVKKYKGYDGSWKINCEVKVEAYTFYE